MPYIIKEIRKDLDPTIDSLSATVNTVGSLNYCITKLCINFLKRSTLSYTILNEIPGVLECVKAEFYRRVIVPYETQKILENGDVYDI